MCCIHTTIPRDLQNDDDDLRRRQIKQALTQTQNPHKTRAKSKCKKTSKKKPIIIKTQPKPTQSSKPKSSQAYLYDVNTSDVCLTTHTRVQGSTPPGNDAGTCALRLGSNGMAKPPAPPRRRMKPFCGELFSLSQRQIWQSRFLPPREKMHLRTPGAKPLFILNQIY